MDGKLATINEADRITILGAMPMKPRTELSMQLYDMLIERGYHEKLCDAITQRLNTDYTATRMIGYLSHYSNLPEEEVVDEMIAILSERDALIKKKETEHAQAVINEIYMYGLGVENDESAGE